MSETPIVDALIMSKSVFVVLDKARELERMCEEMTKFTMHHPACWITAVQVRRCTCGLEVALAKYQSMKEGAK